MRRRSLPVLVFALAAVTAAPRTALGVQDLDEVVPKNACVMVQSVSNPDLAFLDEAAVEVFEAIRDARFDEFALELLAAIGQPQETLDELRGAMTIVGHLVNSVPWHELWKNEIVFAQVMRPPFPWTVGLPSTLLACRVDRARVASVEKSLRGLLAAVASIHDDLLLETRGDGTATRIYGLRYYPAPFPDPVIQIAVNDDRVLFGLGSKTFEESVALMEGRGGKALSETDRYNKAFGELDRNSSVVTYVDMDLMFAGMREQILMTMQGADHLERAAVNDILSLTNGLGTSVTTVRADGLTVIEETWSRFDEQSIASGNPCLMACNSEPSSDLLDYVPIDAYSYSMNSGFDLRPVYDWALERAGNYMPQGSDQLLLWEAMQELADLRIDRDVLSWLGSESVIVTMPSRNPTAAKEEDWIMISRLRDPKGARKVAGRIAGVFNTVVPKLLASLKADLAGTPFFPKIEVGPAEGDLPMLSRLTLTAGVPVLDVTFGFLGNLLIVTSDDSAVEYVLGVAAGEHPSIYENEVLAANGSLPRGPVTSASLIPHARIHERSMKELAQLGPALEMGLGLALGKSANHDPRVGAIKTAVTGCLERVTKIMMHTDFLKYSARWTEMREEGVARYTRANVVYKRPDERLIALSDKR